MDINKKYAVLDNFDFFVRAFKTYHEANCFRIANGRIDWTIISYDPYEYDSTFKQKLAVGFCCQVLGISFNGNLESGKEVSWFLSQFLNIAVSRVKMEKVHND